MKPSTSQGKFPTRVWNKRIHAHRKESALYWTDVFRSGFGMFLLLVLIIGTYFYNKVLQTLPKDYPYEWISLAVLLPLAVFSPIRTHLKEADRVFLLPLESELMARFRSAMIRSGLQQGAGAAAGLIVVWPLIRHCTGQDGSGLLLLLIGVLAVKAANLLGSWRESQLQYARSRAALYGFRWLASAAIVYTLLVKGLVGALLLLACAILVAALYILWTPRFSVNWEHLLERERAQQTMLYSFFSFFTDVPALSYRVKRRAWISSITRYYRFNQENAFLYLYTKTFIRSESFAIGTRLTLLTGVMLIAFDDTYAQLGAFALFHWVTALQIPSMENNHKDLFWKDMYPIPEIRRWKSIQMIVFVTLLIQNVVLSVILIVTGGTMLLAASVFFLIISYLYSFIWLPRRWKSSL